MKGDVRLEMLKEDVKRGESPEVDISGETDGKAGGASKRIELSVAQVAGSAVASVAAAIAASQLGVYGTILGAGVMSIVATTGGTVFQHLFRRTGEQIREAAVQVKPRPHAIPVAGDGVPVASTFLAHPEHREDLAVADGTLQQDGPETRMMPALPESADPTRPQAHVRPEEESTRVLPGARQGEDSTRLLRQPENPGGEARATRVLGQAQGADQATRLLRRTDADDAATRLLRAAGSAGPSGPGSTPQGPADAGTEGFPEEFGAAVTHGTRLRGWRKPLLTAAAVFGVSMAGITGYELLAGHSLSGGHGPTISHIGGNGGGSSRHDGPATEPSVTPSQGEQPGADPSGSGSATESPGEHTSPSPGTSVKDKGTSQGTEKGGGAASSPGTDRSGGQGQSGDGSPAAPTPTPSQSVPPQTGQDGAGNGTGQDGSGQGAEREVQPEQDATQAP
ncbi:hypothetical protein AB0J21_14960 [Streptomyces sp. NPDC049954]|uniref:hypothetical protein n=1 Tax=Streptomyces sp. NPDC049954 TaxID=3155779 RepID=UPI0034133C77